jgi:uncharacterized RDD family membrane protein YckC
MSAPTPFPSPDPYYQPPQYASGPPMGGPPLAGWWSRVGAALLDGLIALGILIVPLIIISVVVFGSLDEDTADPLARLVFSLIGFAYVLVYYPLTMKRPGQHNGQTFGKQIVGIRVVREDGYQFTGGNAVVREFLVKDLLFGYAAACLLYIPTLLNYLWPLWDQRNQALHDKMCNTLVIQA